MRAYAIAGAVVGAVVLGPTARSREAIPTVEVTIYVTGAGMSSRSEELAVRSVVGGMFVSAGVRLNWIDSEPRRGKGTVAPVLVHVRFVRRSWDAHSATALAYVTPFAQVKTITVLFERIRLVSGGHGRERHLLADVLAHEIGHILIGTNGHAKTGVMKEHWDREDLEAMEKKPLEFTSTDLELIREGLQELQARAGDPAGDAHECSGPQRCSKVCRCPPDRRPTGT